MNRSSLEERITGSFIERLQSNNDLSDEFPKILQEEMSQSSFGNDDDIIEAAIEKNHK
jgi:hypothetical protein